MSDREMVNFVSITDSYYNLPMVVEVQRMINRREQRRLRGNRKHKGIWGIKLVRLSLPYWSNDDGSADADVIRVTSPFGK